MLAASLCCPPAPDLPSSLYPQCAGRGASWRSPNFDVAVYNPISSNRHQRTDSLGSRVESAALDIEQDLRRARIPWDHLDVLRLKICSAILTTTLLV
jgi:hypothetical protein